MSAGGGFQNAKKNCLINRLIDSSVYQKSTLILSLKKDHYHCCNTHFYMPPNKLYGGVMVNFLLLLFSLYSSLYCLFTPLLFLPSFLVRWPYLEQINHKLCNGRCILHSAIAVQSSPTHEGAPAIVLTIVAGQDNCWPHCQWRDLRWRRKTRISLSETSERLCGLENVPTPTTWWVANGWNFSFCVTYSFKSECVIAISVLVSQGGHLIRRNPCSYCAAPAYGRHGQLLLSPLFCKQLSLPTVVSLLYKQEMLPSMTARQLFSGRYNDGERYR